MKKTNFKKIILRYRIPFMILIAIILLLLMTQIKYGWVFAIFIVFVIGFLYLMLEKKDLFKKRKNKKTTKKGKTNPKNRKTSPKKKNQTITKKKTTKKKKTKKKPSKKKRSILKIIAIFFLVIVLGCLLGASYFLFLVVSGAPEFDSDKLYQKEASTIYDANGEEIIRIGAEMREKVTYDELPEVLIDAIIATEDARFFQHNGFDLPRFMRAATGQVMGDSLAGGGSTLPMQLSYNLFTSTITTGFEGIVRKFTDIYVSIYQLERHYTKYEIIEFYANAHYLGASAYGVEQASQNYFNKSVSDINLTEAALLSGLFNAPSALNPYRNPQGAENRRNTVLSLMERHGYITAEEREIASSISVESLLAEREAQEVKHLAFVNTVTDEVESKTGHNPYVVPMDIYTTMDREKQDHMDDIFNGDGFNWENEVVQAGAAVVDVETGAIVAIGAGRNHTSMRTYNFATMIKRQIGSASKPLYNYGPAIEYNNWSTYQPLVDEPVSYTSGTAIRNWDHRYEGFSTLRATLARSRNTTALKTFQSVTNSNIYDFVTNLGLSPESDGGTLHEAHSLGGYNGESPLSMSAAYAAFANGGYYIEPYSFTKIVYKETDEVYEPTVGSRTRVMSEETAYMIADVLVDAARIGLGGYSNINNRQYGAKTGTSNFTSETRQRFGLSSSAINDLWVAGTSPQYALSVWYGYERISSEHYTRFGNRRHTHLYQTIGRGIFQDNVRFSRPSGVNVISIEKDSYPAKLPSPYTPSDMIVSELFKDGTEPVEISERFNQLPAPTNLNIEENNNQLTITWDPISIPNYYNNEWLINNYQPLFRSSSYLEKFIDDISAKNQEILGTIGYNIYVKNDDEKEFIAFTTENQYTSSKWQFANKTISVHSAYSKLSDNMSEGIEKTFETDVLNAILNIETEEIINIGDFYQEPTNPISVYLNNDDITNDANIIKTIYDEDANVVGIIDTSQAQTYTIHYNISYNDLETKLTRKVKIVEETN